MSPTTDTTHVMKTIQQRQEQLLEDLDALNERIEVIIESYSRNRGAEPSQAADAA